MKKTLLFSVCAALTASLVSCGGPGGKAKTAETADAKTAKKLFPNTPLSTTHRWTSPRSRRTRTVTT